MFRMHQALRAPENEGTPTGPTTGAHDPAFIAELEALRRGDVEAPEAAVKPEGEEDADPAAAAEPEAEAEEEETEAEPEPEAKKEPEPAADSAEARTIKLLEQRDKKQRADHAARKAELATLEQGLQAREQKLQAQQDTYAKWEAAKARAKLNPHAALDLLGIDGEAAEKLAFAAFARSPKATAQFKAEHGGAQLEQRGEVETLKQTVAEMQAQLAARDKAAETQALVAAYEGGLRTAAKAVLDKSPCLAAAFKKNEAKATAALRAHAAALGNAGQFDELTDAETQTLTVKSYEAHLREEYEALGIPLPNGTTTKDTTLNAGEKKTAKTKTLDNSTGRTTRPPDPTREKTREEELAETVELLKAGAHLKE